MSTAHAMDGPEPVLDLAALFARGILRLRKHDIRITQISEDSSAHGLDHCSTSRPCGVDAQESVRKDARRR